FDESLVLARRRLGLSVILQRPRRGGNERAASQGRINSARPRGDELPALLRATAEECNEWDMALYDYGVELFDGAPERDDPGFAVSVAALEAARADGKIKV